MAEFGKVQLKNDFYMFRSSVMAWMAVVQTPSKKSIFSKS